MNERISAVDNYARLLKNSRKSKLPAGYPLPRPPDEWSEENRELLERYLDWLIADGAGHRCIWLYYIPTAGHLLGYHLEHHEKLCLETAQEPVLDYLKAKQTCKQNLVMSGHALARFGRFLQDERGETRLPINLKQPNVSAYQRDLPEWLIEQLTKMQHVRQANWRQTRLAQSIIQFWHKHTTLWRWLLTHYEIEQVSDIKRAYVLAYMDERLAKRLSVKGINQDLRNFQATLLFLQEREFTVPRALLRITGLKEPDSLPRFLTDEQVGRLQSDLEQRVRQAETPTQRRNTLLDRAAFYLLWQSGLRLSEVEELTRDDLNLSQKQIIIRKGKGLKDRAVYLTETAIVALQAYLKVRGSSVSDHLFLFRHKPLSKEFLRLRIKASGTRTGVMVTPHRLRHTYATQLVNAGCNITTIQALLGHKHLNNTLAYARVHDRTVAEDYYAAMAVVEKRLEPHLNLPEEPEPTPNSHNPGQTDTLDHLLTLVTTLQTEPLTESQQMAVTELQQGLTTLANSLNVIPIQPNEFVKELMMPP